MKRRIGRLWLSLTVERESDRELAQRLEEIAYEIARESGYGWEPVERLYAEAQALRGMKVLGL